MGDSLKKTIAGMVAGATLAVGGSAALADGPQCGKAVLTGVSAVHRLALPDGGVLEGWYGTGHGIAPNTAGKPVEFDAACQAKTLGELEAVCLAQWKKSCAAK